MKRLIFVVLALALVAAACGDDDSATTTAAPTTTAATTTAAPTTAPPETDAPTTTAAEEGVTVTGDDGVEVTITDTSSIVSLSGDLTEILFALGFGDRVVAVDVTTTFPPEAAEIPVIGFGQQLAPEPVLGMRPSLVLANELTGPPEAIEQMRGAGIPVLVIAGGTSLDDPARKIRLIGEVMGAPEEAEALAIEVDAEIQAALDVAAQAEASPNAVFVYSRGPELLLVFGVGTATNAMLTGAGAVDVGAEAVHGAAPLSAELLAAMQPDVIVLPESGFLALGGAEAFLEVPGVAQTPAGENQNFLAYDEAYFFNLGPRTGEALMEFVLDLYPELDPNG
jgi:iron complex transport system substrate-binding protein